MATNSKLKTTIDSLRALIASLAAGTIHLDLHTHLHHADVKKYVSIICANFGMSDKDTKIMTVAAELHDLGKIGVLDVLTRTRNQELKQKSEEMETIRHHCEIGERMLQAFMAIANIEIVTANTIIAATLHHHERWDGKGYPAKLSKYSIPLSARIVAVGDSISAMTMTERPWKNPLKLKEVVAELRNNVATQFDPEIAAVTAEMLEQGRLKLEDFG